MVIVDCALTPINAVTIIASTLLLSGGIRKDYCTLISTTIGRNHYYVFASGSNVRLLRNDTEVLAGLAKKLLSRGTIGGMKLVSSVEALEIMKQCCMNKNEKCVRINCNAPVALWLWTAIISIMLDRGGLDEWSC